MKSLGLSRYALAMGATSALLAGCGGTQPPIGAQAAIPDSWFVRDALHRTAITPKAKGRRALLYVSTQSADTYVYTYPRAKLRSAIATLFNANGLCSDAAGNVFITSQPIHEYQHGQDNPIAELSNPFGEPSACSVDPTTGKLAVVSGPGLAVYKPEVGYQWHLPKLYIPSAAYLAGGGYDSKGNLFIDGETKGSKLFFAELPRGDSGFQNITPDVEITTPGGIQWDGQYLAVGDERNTVIHRFAISGSSAKQVGSLTLSGASGIGQFWIQGDRVIGPDLSNETVGLWKYPEGGTAVKSILVSEPYGATVSY